MKIEFCLPIKNEAGVLQYNLRTLLDYLNLEFKDFDWQIIGVVNGSTDNSYQILQDFERFEPDKVKSLLIKESGKGRALKTAWRKSQADILVFMDADLAVDLEGAKRLILPLINNEADLSLGSRFLKDSDSKRSRRRGILSWGYVLFSKALLKHQQTDIQCGFKAIKKESFMAIEQYLQDDHWFFDTELVTLVKLSGGRLKEIPVKWRENRVGLKKSNIKVFQDSCRFAWNVVCFKRRLNKIKKYLNDNAK